MFFYVGKSGSPKDSYTIISCARLQRVLNMVWRLHRQSRYKR